MNNINKSEDFFSIEYCPHCGSKSFSRDSEKSFLCQKCNFKFFQNPACAGAVIIEYDNKILFTVRNREPSKGKLDLPGGFIDFNETAEQGMIREVKEELNLEIDNLVYLASFPNKYIYKRVLYHTLDVIFYTKIDELNNIKLDDEIESYALLGKDEIDVSELAFDSLKKGVLMYLSKS